MWQINSLVACEVLRTGTASSLNEMKCVERTESKYSGPKFSPIKSLNPISGAIRPSYTAVCLQSPQIQKFTLFNAKYSTEVNFSKPKCIKCPSILAPTGALSKLFPTFLDFHPRSAHNSCNKQTRAVEVHRKFAAFPFKLSFDGLVLCL